MIRIAHIINPVKIDNPKSDLVTAQPITFETMRRAQKASLSKLEVELLSVQYPEDHTILPEGFRILPDLTRSVLDFGKFTSPRKYPLIQDIIQRAFDHSDAEYLIYSNVDIALKEDFYLRVAELIDSGHDALIINRRRISDKYVRIEQIGEMWQEKGLSHPGFDCFVFHRSIVPKMSLEGVCIGVPFIGILTAQNLFALSRNCKVITDEFLTQHIGLEIFKKRAPAEYLKYNQQAFWKAIPTLWNELSPRKLPFWNWFPPYRIIKWGLHPSIPIRLVLKLEWREFASRMIPGFKRENIRPPGGPKDH